MHRTPETRVTDVSTFSSAWWSDAFEDGSSLAAVPEDGVHNTAPSSPRGAGSPRSKLTATNPLADRSTSGNGRAGVVEVSSATESNSNLNNNTGAAQATAPRTTVVSVPVTTNVVPQLLPRAAKRNPTNDAETDSTLSESSSTEQSSDVENSSDLDDGGSGTLPSSSNLNHHEEVSSSSSSRKVPGSEGRGSTAYTSSLGLASSAEHDLYGFRADSEGSTALQRLVLRAAQLDDSEELLQEEDGTTPSSTPRSRWRSRNAAKLNELAVQKRNALVQQLLLRMVEADGYAFPKSTADLPNSAAGGANSTVEEGVSKNLTRGAPPSFATSLHNVRQPVADGACCTCLFSSHLAESGSTRRGGAMSRREPQQGAPPASSSASSRLFSRSWHLLSYQNVEEERQFQLYLYRGEQWVLTLGAFAFSLVAFAFCITMDAFSSTWLGLYLCLLGVFLFGFGALNAAWWILSSGEEQRAERRQHQLRRKAARNTYREQIERKKQRLEFIRRSKNLVASDQRGGVEGSVFGDSAVSTSTHHAENMKSHGSEIKPLSNFRTTSTSGNVDMPSNGQLSESQAPPRSSLRSKQAIHTHSNNNHSHPSVAGGGGEVFSSLNHAAPGSTSSQMSNGTILAKAAAAASVDQAKFSVVMYEQFCLAFASLVVIGFAFVRAPAADVCIRGGSSQHVPVVALEPCRDLITWYRFAGECFICVMLPLRSCLSVPLVLASLTANLLFNQLWSSTSAGGMTVIWTEIVLSLSTVVLSVASDIVARRVFENGIRMRAEAAQSNTVRSQLDKALEALLPRSVVRRLAAQEPVIDVVPAAAVAVTELFDYAMWSTTVMPFEMVRSLNGLYSAFDEAVLRYDVDKMKAVGDRYIVTSGLQRRASFDILKAFVDAKPSRSGLGKRASDVLRPLGDESMAEADAASLRLVLFGLYQLTLLSHLNRLLPAPLSFATVISCGNLLGALVGKGGMSYAVFGETIQSAIAAASKVSGHDLSRRAAAGQGILVGCQRTFQACAFYGDFAMEPLMSDERPAAPSSLAQDAGARSQQQRWYSIRRSEDPAVSQKSNKLQQQQHTQQQLQQGQGMSVGSELHFKNVLFSSAVAGSSSTQPNEPGSTLQMSLVSATAALQGGGGHQLALPLPTAAEEQIGGKSGIFEGPNHRDMGGPVNPIAMLEATRYQRIRYDSLRTLMTRQRDRRRVALEATMDEYQSPCALKPLFEQMEKARQPAELRRAASTPSRDVAPLLTGRLFFFEVMALFAKNTADCEVSLLTSFASSWSYAYHALLLAEEQQAPTTLQFLYHRAQLVVLWLRWAPWRCWTVLEAPFLLVSPELEERYRAFVASEFYRPHLIAVGLECSLILWFCVWSFADSVSEKHRYSQLSLSAASARYSSIVSQLGLTVNHSTSLFAVLPLFELPNLVGLIRGDLPLVDPYGSRGPLPLERSSAAAIPIAILGLCLTATLMRRPVVRARQALSPVEAFFKSFRIQRIVLPSIALLCLVLLIGVFPINTLNGDWGYVVVLVLCMILVQWQGGALHLLAVSLLPLTLIIVLASLSAAHYSQKWAVASLVCLIFLLVVVVGGTAAARNRLRRAQYRGLCLCNALKQGCDDDLQLQLALHQLMFPRHVLSSVTQYCLTNTQNSGSRNSSQQGNHHASTMAQAPHVGYTDGTSSSAYGDQAQFFTQLVSNPGSVIPRAESVIVSLQASMEQPLIYCQAFTDLVVLEARVRWIPPPTTLAAAACMEWSDAEVDGTLAVCLAERSLTAFDHLLELINCRATAMWYCWFLSVLRLMEARELDDASHLCPSDYMILHGHRLAEFFGSIPVGNVVEDLYATALGLQPESNDDHRKSSSAKVAQAEAVEMVSDMAKFISRMQVVENSITVVGMLEPKVMLQTLTSLAITPSSGTKWADSQQHSKRRSQRSSSAQQCSNSVLENLLTDLLRDSDRRRLFEKCVKCAQDSTARDEFINELTTEWDATEIMQYLSAWAMMELLALLRLVQRNPLARIRGWSEAEATISVEREATASSVSEPRPSLQPIVTAICCNGASIGAVMGKHRVSYHVFGVSTRHTGALLAAAPTGFIGCTSSVLRLLRFPQFAVSRTAPANPASPSSHPAMLLCQDLITREKEDEEDHHQESPQAAAAQLSSDPSEIPNVQMLMQAADSCNRSVTLFGRRLMETWRNTTHRNNSANTATPAGGGGPQPSASSPLAVADHDDGGGLTEWLTRVQEEAETARRLSHAGFLACRTTHCSVPGYFVT
jgi:class 3 adenylate cyclase